MRTRLSVLGLIAVALFVAPGAPAQAQQKRLVTIAARSCPSYADITANRARNNIMESLEDLGVDTPYGSDGRPLLVDAATEEQFQPNCTPIDNWQFTLGRGYRSRAVSGVWGSLSIATDPFSPTIVTQAGVPLRDSRGDPVGTTTIAGATTIELTPEQAGLSQQGNKLWIQGGTPTVPITDSVTYGFGALRCATDNLNGDNVEWISYPPDTVHVFCFAYYVKPAPTSGTIVVRKEVDLPTGVASEKLRFTGDISFAEGGEFFLTATESKPGSQSFIRAADRAWTFREELGPLGTLTAIDCVSARPGASSWITDTATRETVVTLGRGDTVTCTYRNTFRRPPAGLTLRKISRGALGTFGFDLEGQEASASAQATTVADGVAAIAEPAADVADLPAGAYRVTETSPPDRGGTWSLDRVACSPAEFARAADPVTIEIPDGPGTVCTFTNVFTPAGRITLRKITLGGTATTRFQVRARDGASRPQREQVATTTEPGEAVRAEGDALTELPVGVYDIKETIGGPDRWRLQSVVCDGVPVPSVAGQIQVALTDANPATDCTFVNERIPDVVPPDPAPDPDPTPGPPVEVPDEGGTAGVEESAQLAELRITKQARPRTVPIGDRTRFTITVVNRGPDPAEGVTVAEPGATPRGGRLSLVPSRGSCRERTPRFCDFGTLAPGERATIRVSVRTANPGRYINRVAVNTLTRQRTRRGKRASARVRVVAAPLPRYTG